MTDIDSETRNIFLVSETLRHCRKVCPSVRPSVGLSAQMHESKSGKMSVLDRFLA